MTKFTVIDGGKVTGKVVTMSGTNYLVPTPTADERRQVVALFKQAIRSHVEAVADSGILTRTAVLELAQQVLDDMDERI
jgi:hypothetical protein